MNAYNITLHAHSGFRWLVLLLAIVLIIKSLIGLFGSGKYGKLDNILSASFVGFMHLQLLIGLILYFFLSPITTSAFDDFGAAMGNAGVRYWAVEHITVMILAIAAAQIGRSVSKKAQKDSIKFRQQAIFYTISLALMLTRIPWDRV
jgi:hypothetical protein